jgi:hypothetical protein
LSGFIDSGDGKHALDLGVLELHAHSETSSQAEISAVEHRRIDREASLKIQTDNLKEEAGIVRFSQQSPSFYRVMVPSKKDVLPKLSPNTAKL